MKGERFVPLPQRLQSRQRCGLGSLSLLHRLSTLKAVLVRTSDVAEAFNEEHGFSKIDKLEVAGYLGINYQEWWRVALLVEGRSAQMKTPHAHRHVARPTLKPAVKFLQQ